jgi:hypothetical protein
MTLRRAGPESPSPAAASERPGRSSQRPIGRSEARTRTHRGLHRDIFRLSVSWPAWPRMRPPRVLAPPSPRHLRRGLPSPRSRSQRAAHGASGSVGHPHPATRTCRARPRRASRATPSGTQPHRLPVTRERQVHDPSDPELQSAAHKTLAASRQCHRERTNLVDRHRHGADQDKRPPPFCLCDPNAKPDLFVRDQTQRWPLSVSTDRFPSPSRDRCRPDVRSAGDRSGRVSPW